MGIKFETRDASGTLGILVPGMGEGTTTIDPGHIRLNKGWAGGLE